MPAVWDAVVAGVALGMRYNPVAAMLASAVVAAYLAWGETRQSRVAIGAAVIAAAWLIGDGLRVIGHAREAYDGASSLLAAGAPSWAEWTALALWALVGLGAGYVLPAWAGVHAGRRTVMGVDWLVAASVAFTVTVALSALFGVLGR